MQITMPAQLGDFSKKASSFLHFILSGQVIVSFVRWLVTTGGNVAESAFLLATLWVTINNVAHLIVTWILPASVIQVLNQISVIAFSVLPELIIFAAIKITFDHWRLFFRSKEKMSLAWAIAYTPFTICFAVMTVLVLSSFVSVQATADVSPQATGAMLVIRCLAGWGYGVIQMLFASIGRQGYASTIERLNSIIQSVNGTLADRDNTIAGLQSDIVSLQQLADEQEREIVSLKVSLASKRLSRRRDTRPNDSHTFEATETDDTLTISGNGMTVIATGKKRQELKSAMQKAIMQGERVNLRKISQDVGVSYGTARNHAKSIMQELSQELPAIAAPGRAS